MLNFSKFLAVLMVSPKATKPYRRAMFSTLMGLSSTVLSSSIVPAEQTTNAAMLRDRIVTEAALRVSEPAKAMSNPKVADAVKRYVAALGSNPAALTIIEKLNVDGLASELITTAISLGASSDGVKAIDLALKQKAFKAIEAMMVRTEDQTSVAEKQQAQVLAKLLSLSNRGDAMELLKKVLQEPNVDPSIRITAATGLARKVDGQRFLLELAAAKKLSADAATIVAATLRGSQDASIAQQAAALFPALAAAGKPLPPIDTLAEMRGSWEAGKKAFDSVATCAQCHTVRGSGKNVGPDLSEIGDKLTREAMLVAIVNPSAGISHNYEAYSALTSDDEVVTGLLVSKNDNELILKDKDGIERKLSMDNVEVFKKLETSLMPNNLQDLVDQQGLVDIVEYMTTLKKL